MSLDSVGRGFNNDTNGNSDCGTMTTAICAGGRGRGGSGDDPGTSRMTHSLSTPSGVDGTGPSTPQHSGGKKLAIRVQLLDDAVTMFQVQAKALGRVLFEQVCRQLSLLEADYFGLEYQEQGSTTRYWIDLEKPLNRQVGFSLIEPMLRFCVKFYAADPAQLEEEYTRYLFCLQIRRDLTNGVLQCNDNTGALMASYIVQSQCGDFVTEDYPDHTYLSSGRFLPNQDETMQRRIMECHKKHIGQTPGDADLNLLETARRCELYGMKMHEAKDVEGVPLNLAVAHMGIAVFQGITRLNTFSWAKIRKISFKRKRFLVKLHSEGGQGYYRDTVEFFFDGRNECKNFWKKCVENHGFFRCPVVHTVSRRKARVLSRGSSFRYSGKTQKQIIEFVRDNYVKRQTFQRSQSFRQGPLHASSRSQSHTSCNVNASISAHPLLPIETAEWDFRSRRNDSTTPSQTRRAADSANRPSDSRTDSNKSQVTAAQVETYPTTRYAPDTPPAASAAAHQLMDSSHSASPAGTWSSTRTPHPPPPHSSTSSNTSNSMRREADRGRARHDGHSSDIYHGINGNVSLDRRGELVTQPPSRFDLTLGSDKSGSLSRSEGGVYDIGQAESQHRTALTDAGQNAANNNVSNGGGAPANGHINGGGGGGGSSSSNSLGNNNGTLDSNDGDVRKRWPTEPAYFLAKEILMTERTYKKDLDILNTWFREELPDDDVESLQPLFHLVESMVQHHGIFLRDLEHRLLLWEGRGGPETHRIGDILLKNMVVLPIYEEYLEHHADIVDRLHEMYEHSVAFQAAYREFELQKICYIPISALVLKPLHRLLHYHLILEKLLDLYGTEHHDRTDCEGTLVMLGRTTHEVRIALPATENFALLCELQRDLSGFDRLVQPDRRLVRQGCLLKHSRRGLQQRMFFLFSDVLLYGNKSPVNQAFKVLGHVPVRSMLTENAEHNAFVIYGGQRAITVSAGTTVEKTLWLAELAGAAAALKALPHVQLSMGTLKNCSSSEEGLETCGLSAAAAAAAAANSTVAAKVSQSRSNTSLHVCWHRGATVSLHDHLRTGEHQLSGYLLRKFKNSSGWQKLWVVFTSFCLYFYKNYQDEFALASLPLLGYAVGPPGYQDAVQKEFVFKLSFKNHIYFFRAESEHTYNRWLDVLRSTTLTQDFKSLTAAP